MRLGLTLPTIPLDAPACVELARNARSLGYDEIWMAEVGGHDSYALAAAAAQASPGMRIGTAIVPAQTRAPMVHAMAAAVLDQLTDGNFVLGIGISSENIIAGWAGLPFDRPLRRMREHVEVLRRILDGEKVTYEGETLSVNKFRLQTKLTGRIPIYMGALNPGMLRLAGKLADGVIINMVPEDALGRVLGEVYAGAEAAGRDPASLEVIARLHVAVTDDAERDRGLVKMGFGAYAATSVYNRFFRWIGFEDEAAAIAEAYGRGDREGVAAAMTPDLCDAMAIVADPDGLRARIRAYVEQGVDVAVLNPIVPSADAQMATLQAGAGALDGLDTAQPKGVVRAAAG